MENLKRYGPFNCPECGGCMTEESVGEYVKFSDIKDILNKSDNTSSPKLPDTKECIEHAMSKFGDGYYHVTPSMLIGCIQRFIAGNFGR